MHGTLEDSKWQLYKGPHHKILMVQIPWFGIFGFNLKIILAFACDDLSILLFFGLINVTVARIKWNIL